MNEYTDTRAVYPNTFEYPGSLIRANQIEVQYRHSDVMCLEQVFEKQIFDQKIKFLILNNLTIWCNRNKFQLTITEGNYRIDLIADWDQKAFNIEKYPYKAQKPAWKSLTGKYHKNFCFNFDLKSSIFATFLIEKLKKKFQAKKSHGGQIPVRRMTDWSLFSSRLGINATHIFFSSTTITWRPMVSKI